ncbi:MAG TPA: glycoside hydrolase family 2 TIM barrel-domain containing protein [Sediminibacterium sp.]|nr:glycoside hydrolase family 2 TIM barrel-domain containing protein [Sediminibacterium sp.]
MRISPGFILSLLLPISFHVSAQETILHYLSGTDKDHTINWQFFCTDGAHSGYWTTIPVPSNWELQGFGGYNYGHDKNKHHEQGLYKYHFKTDPSWKNRSVELVFEGVMTDADVRINGQSVGPVHQGSFYRFSYAVTSLLRTTGDNLLEVTVSKMSADSSVNHAEREGDFWVFGGIYRPVYLKISPATHINRVAIDARADGQFHIDVFPENVQPGDSVITQITTLKGVKAGKAFAQVITTNNPDKITLTDRIDHPALWNPEQPNLYLANVRVKRGKQVLHVYHQRFGFRTIEVRPGDGIYINNVKQRFKGVDRHSFWPESGRTLSRGVHLMDIGLMKDMNMNAVRMSHYPPDAEFLDLCDSLGLFVLDELTGWHQKYNTTVGKKLVKEMVERDVNHASIVFWDNGNEGGFNFELDKEFAKYDPQERTVLHPWSDFNHIDTKHYPDYSYVEKAAGKPEILLHTEMIHGLYDGGHGAGLDDYWQLMLQNPRHAGGFLWVLADEGIVRRDWHDSIDTHGNNAPDGIVGPHREKEGSFYTIKAIWSPVQVVPPRLDQSFDGRLRIENQYAFTNLSACRFYWQLLQYAQASENKTGHTMIANGSARLQLAPGKQGTLALTIPPSWQKADALLLKAVDPYSRELNTWIWSIKTPADILARRSSKIRAFPVSTQTMQTDKNIIILNRGIRFNFSKSNGFLTAIEKGNRIMNLSDGPQLACDSAAALQFIHTYRNRNSTVVEALYIGTDSLLVSWTFQEDSMPHLRYAYTRHKAAYYAGISFRIMENILSGMKWLGDGPYHVWKNRLKGMYPDVWQKKYNQTVTGETWNYPEFPGYHANLYWVQLQGRGLPCTIYTDKPGIFLQVSHTPAQQTIFNPFVNPPFPAQNLGFLHAIPPIGSKFKGAATMGPQSQINPPVAGMLTGSLWFDFD